MKTPKKQSSPDLSKLLASSLTLEKTIRKTLLPYVSDNPEVATALLWLRKSLIATFMHSRKNRLALNAMSKSALKTYITNWKPRKLL